MTTARPSQTQACAPRFKTGGDHLMVSSKTIGTAMTYQLSTENVSRSGMLLTWDQRNPVPFSENTILEMTIDPSGQILDIPVSCLGKVVRKVETLGNGRKRVQFGVRIVQIDHQDLDKWEHCLSSIASKSGLEVSNKTPDLLKEHDDKTKLGKVN